MTVSNGKDSSVGMKLCGLRFYAENNTSSKVDLFSGGMINSTL